ncbi:MAG TPA: DUF2891 domain-containing protein [Tepidisphaeraceae bacterium]|nr:DUF2891 domain-containing protein [Tepidisphaeraceae bacterium]
MPALSLSTATSFAAATLSNVVREYPNYLSHVLEGPADVQSPRELHPVFFGCFDWHSCVHGYWQLATLHRLFPRASFDEAVVRQFSFAFTDDNVAREAAYFLRPASRAFERPYGWAWLLALSAALLRGEDEIRREWHHRLMPLVSIIADRWKSFLHMAAFPVRDGQHGNTAFALILTRDFATAVGDLELLERVDACARSWYADDGEYAGIEPSLADFLSPALVEARCMAEVLPADEFRGWLGAFLPQIERRNPAEVFCPVHPTDRTDGKIAHLDGLNFSRAWCMAGIARALPHGDPRRSVLLLSAADHIAVSLPHIATHYAGGHWLPTFAVMALLAVDACSAPGGA